MRICFIGPANSYHIVKWCTWFSKHNHEVHLISFAPTSNYTSTSLSTTAATYASLEERAKIKGTTIHFVNIHVDPNGSDFQKLKYLTTGKKIRKLVEAIDPDIINVHYATSYGVAVALSGIKNYILSVWGSDVYDFPKKSIFHKLLLKFILNRATWLFSTSKAMAVEAGRYTKKVFEITPFGVDMNLFNPNKRDRSGKVIEPADGFVVGTIKSLSPKCGIDYLLKAVAIVKQEHPDIPINLRIAGRNPNDPNEEEYKNLARELQIEGITTWLGCISQEEAAVEWANLDLGIVYSTIDSESFGVSAVEAEACETPLIISDIPGLMEATFPGKTSFVVERKDEKALADAIVMLYKNPNLRLKMGHLGRMYILDDFEINQCFKKVNEYLIEYRYSSQQRRGVKINVAIFHPDKRTRSRVCVMPRNNDYVVGTVKSLEYVYGIDIFLKAVASFKQKHPEIPISIRIAGKGTCDDEYKKMAYDLGLDDFIAWLGFISQKDAAREWSSMDLAVLASRRESFGVSAIEAQACGVPVVISDVDGLIEVTSPNESSMILEQGNDRELVKFLTILYQDTSKREQMGLTGRKIVENKFAIDECFSEIEHLYENKLSLINKGNL